MRVAMTLQNRQWKSIKLSKRGCFSTPEVHLPAVIGNQTRRNQRWVFQIAAHASCGFNPLSIVAIGIDMKAAMLSVKATDKGSLTAAQGVILAV
jgi:hypothetical protein